MSFRTSLVLVTIAGCAYGTPSDGSGTEAVEGGRLHRDAVGSFADHRDLQLASVFPTLLRSVGTPLDGIVLDDLAITVQTDSATASGGRLTHVSLRQTVGGVPIVDTHLGLTLRPQDAAHEARLLASSYRLYPDAQVDTVPQIDAAAATALAHAELGNGAVRSSELVIRRLDGRLELAWDVSIVGAPARAVVIASGPRAGAVEQLDDRVHVSSGTVTGTFATVGAPGGTGTQTTGGLGGLTITAGGATAITAADGTFSIDAAPGSSIVATLSGRALSVESDNGTAVQASAPAAPTVSLAMGSASETDLAQVNVYHFTEGTRAYLEANGFEPAAFGAPITAYANKTDESCNAYYQNRTVNFYKSGGGCGNTAVDSVVTHEYGHFVDDAYGSIQDGGLSEGWGDLLACYILDRADLRSLSDDGSIERSCNNTYQYQANDEVHALGTAWSGFAWEVRVGLGDALARQLVLPSLESNAANIPAAVREVFLRDDDDGDLTNQTPHWDVLMAAAENHALAFAVEGDGGGDGGGGDDPGDDPGDPPPGGGCTHDVCEPGEPLAPDCDPCVAEICAMDDFCCTMGWDEQCAMGAAEICGAPCDGGGDPGDPPPDDPPPGGGECEACIGELCGYDPYCCEVEWDEQCDAEAYELCGGVCM